MSAHRSSPLATLRAEVEDSGLMVLLDDPDVTDVMVNPGSVFVTAQRRGTYDAGFAIEPDRLESLIASLAGIHGLVVDREHPILEADLPFHGVRAQAVLPPVSTAPLLTLRRPAGSAFSLDDLVTLGSLSPAIAERLRAAVLGGETLLVAGGVGSGKTTLLSSLLGELLRAVPNLRLVLCEEGCRELHARGANVVRLLASEEAGVSLTRLLRCALRLNPDRIIVGEARGAEALDFLRACNTGHPGGMLTLHANSAEDALYRLDDLVQEAGVPSQLERIARAVDLVVFLEREGTRRRAAEVVEAHIGADGGLAVKPVADARWEHDIDE